MRVNHCWYFYVTKGMNIIKLIEYVSLVKTNYENHEFEFIESNRNSIYIDKYNEYWINKIQLTEKKDILSW